MVIGSSNTDLVIRTPRFPSPGETLIGGAFDTFAGGKGANQAVAACRLGGDVTFVTKIGLDSFGESALSGFEKEGIHTSFVFKDEDLPSGVAMIMLDANGQNSIIVAPGANQSLSEADIQSISEALSETDLLLLQLEVPLNTVLFSIRQAHEIGKRVILNPAPAVELPFDIYPLIDIITPNESEAKILTGIEVVDKTTASKAASRLLDMGVGHVVITMGDMGVFYKDAKSEIVLPAKKTQVVDTTGAGDIFNGALAVCLAEGRSWEAALQFANIAASIGVGRMGAQASVPFRAEVDQLL